MARFNELLVGRYNRLVQKLFSMKGGASLVTLSDEMFAVLPLFYGAENRYLEGWDRYGANPTVTTSTSVPAFRLRNPAGSNVIAVVEKIVYFNTVADTAVLQGGVATADLTTTFGVVGFDSRSRATGSVIPSAGLTQPNLAATALKTGNAAFLGVDIIVTDIQELPLLPGSALQIIGGSTTAVPVCSWLWRERFLEESERT